MIRLRQMLLVINMICLPCCALGLSYDIVEKQHDIQNILKAIRVPVNVGMVVRDLDSGRVLFGQNTNLLYPPASTQKLFTAIAALYYLNQHYRFHTTLYRDGLVQDHTLMGHVVIRFSGDPSLRVSDLKQLLLTLKAQGIRKIMGSVYLDSSAYNEIPYPPGWLWDDLSYSYAAPLQAINLNRNAFALQMTPSKTMYAPPQLKSALPDAVVSFENHVRTTHGNEPNCPFLIYSHADNRYTIYGCINQKWGSQQRTLAIRNPILYAKVLVSRMLIQQGIAWTGSVNVLHHPYGHPSTEMADHPSVALYEMVTEMLKKSDNLIAESLLKKIGEYYYRRSGSVQNGLRALKQILKPTGIDFSHNNINDGSGLSRYNLVTPLQFSRLLSFAYQTHAVRVPLLAALPRASVDGTLIARMHWIRDKERVMAKTGSMTGVSALVGYVHTRSGHTLSFVLMLSGFLGKQYRYHQLEDQLCRYLVEQM